MVLIQTTNIVESFKFMYFKATRFYSCINNEHIMLARKCLVNLFFIGDSDDTIYIYIVIEKSRDFNLLGAKNFDKVA